MCGEGVVLGGEILEQWRREDDNRGRGGRGIE